MLTLITGNKQLTISREGLISLAMTFPITDYRAEQITFTDRAGVPFYVVSPPLAGLDLRGVLKSMCQA